MRENISCVSVLEMSKILGISKTAAYNLANKAEFYPSFRIGARIIINRCALANWISEATNKDGDSECL